MERSTIDFGIDLGTTNSAVALLSGVATEIIKNNDDADVTPSAVSIDKRGTVRVGRAARDRMRDDPDNAFGEFKRQMGSDHVYHFKTTNTDKRPEDLSAEVLKELRGNVQQRLGEPINAAVITVPAAFELHQCDATRRAAELAGFSDSPLLQEPVAAALAYGFQVDKIKAYWLVYDFGGGTFDAAVIKSEEGTVRVVNHGGDNFLGGSDIDWAIVDGLLVPRLTTENKLADFTRDNPRWRAAFAKLKRSVELAKIQLSRSERATLEECKFADQDGESIECDFELTRADVARAAEPIIRRSVEICQRVLKEKNLGRSAVERVILVGGPTLAPYFREALAEGLGIALDHTVDPLTVVARGAAIFAGTQRRAGQKAAAVAGAFLVDLKHKPVGFDSAPLVGGRIASPGGQPLTGYTIELVNQKRKWRSGKVPVAANGVFTATLRAEKGEGNVYVLELLDARGQRQTTSPETLTYTIGAVVDEQPLLKSIGVGLSGNEVEGFLEKGSALPAKATKVLLSAAFMAKGATGNALTIPVCEGEAGKADRNRLVGSLAIAGTTIKRDLPEHSEIEITLLVDASRVVRVSAYVPLLDQDFETELTLSLVGRAPEELRADVAAELERVREVKAKAIVVGDSNAQRLIQNVEGGAVRGEIERLAAGATNSDTAAKCESRLLELRLQIDEASDRLEWPGLVSEARELAARLLAELNDNGEASQKATGAKLAGEIESLVKARKPDDLRQKMKQADSLYWRIIFAQPAFWVYQFQEREKGAAAMQDPKRATRLLDQGRAFISQNNSDGLRNVVLELWKLMPDAAVEEVKRGYHSGLVRAQS